MNWQRYPVDPDIEAAFDEMVKIHPPSTQFECKLVDNRLVFNIRKNDQA